jgi:hypothetical protein
MKQIFSAIIFILFISPIVFVQNALAGESKASAKGPSGFFFDETFFPKLTDSNDTGSFPDSRVASETGFGLDSRTTIGYILDGAWFFGGTYNTYSISTSRSNVSGGDSGRNEKFQNTQMGPTIGWVTGNLRFMGTYFISGEKVDDVKDSDDTGLIGHTKITNKDVTGMQLLVGYAFPITSNFSIGPSIIYRTLQYRKQAKINYLSPAEDYSSKKLYTANTESNLDMMFSLMIHF